MTKKKNSQNSQMLTDAHTDFEKSLNSYASFKVSNKDTGTDMVQDTFLKTWSYLVKGGKIEIMKAFLYKILNNLIVDHYRKKKTVSLDAMMQKGFEPVAKDTGNFSNSLSNLNDKSVLILIEQLPVSYRKIIHMRYIQELSLKEISMITGQSRNAASVQIHRGLKKLKSLYYA